MTHTIHNGFINTILASVRVLNARCVKCVPQQSVICIYFGILNIITAVLVVIPLNHDIFIIYAKQIHILQLIILITSILLIIHTIWPNLLSHFVYIIWIVSAFCTLFLVCLITILSKFSQTLLMLLLINTIIFAFIIKPFVLSLITIPAIATSVFSYSTIDSILSIRITTFHLLYISFAFIANLLIFAKHQKDIRANKAYLRQKTLEIKKEMETSALQYVPPNTHDIRHAIFSNLNQGIREPLKALENSITALSDATANSTDTQIKEIINISNNSINKLYFYIFDLLELSRFEIGDVSLDIKQHDMEILINDIALEYIKHFVVIVNYEKLAPRILEFDLEKINYLIRHLLDNAVKHSKTSKVRINVFKYTMHYYDKPEIDGIKICIIDEGIGIPENEIDAIFEPFEQSTRTQNISKGRGIGLTLCRHIVHYHYGQIYASHTPDFGATFTFTLPIIHEANKTLIETPHKTNITSISRNITLLLIDDEVTILKSISSILQLMNYEVEVATSGVEGIKAIQDNPDKFSVILLDFMMPDLNGNEFLKKIQSIIISHNIKVIIQSGYITEAQFHESQRLGASALILKPYSAKELLNVIKTTQASTSNIQLRSKL